MAEPQNDRQRPERYEETTDPRNPPNSVINESVRRTALGSYLGPLVVFFLVVGMALIYWANRGPVVPDPEDREQIGTTGSPSDRDDVAGERSRDDTPGGSNPDPRHGSTASEVEYRAGNPDPPAFPGTRPEGDLTGLAMLEGEPKNVVGRSIDVRNVSVADVQDSSHFWVQDGSHKVEVMAPRGGSAMKTGSRVNVNGVVEEDGRGGVRIRAERVGMN